MEIQRTTTRTQIPSILWSPHPLGPQNPLHSADKLGKGMHLNHFDLMSHISFMSLLWGELITQPHPVVQVTRKI